MAFVYCHVEADYLRSPVSKLGLVYGVGPVWSADREDFIRLLCEMVERHIVVWLGGMQWVECRHEFALLLGECALDDCAGVVVGMPDEDVIWLDAGDAALVPLVILDFSPAVQKMVEISGDTVGAVDCLSIVRKGVNEMNHYISHSIRI